MFNVLTNRKGEIVCNVSSFEIKLHFFFRAFEELGKALSVETLTGILIACETFLGACRAVLGLQMEDEAEEISNFAKLFLIKATEYVISYKTKDPVQIKQKLEVLHQQVELGKEIFGAILEQVCIRCSKIITVKFFLFFV